MEDSVVAVRLNGDHTHTPLGKKPYETPRALSVDELKGTVNDYLRLMASLMAVVGQESFLAEIMEAADAAGVIKVFEKYET